MTEYTDFVAFMNEVETVKQMQDQRQDPRKAVLEKADEDLRKYAYRFLVDKKLIDPTIVTDPSKLTPERLEQGVKSGLKKAYKNAANVFSTPANLDAILNTQMPVSKLELLAGTKQIREKADGADADAFNRYTQYKSLESFRDRYNAGGKLSEEEQEVVVSYAIGGVIKETRDRFKADGADIDEQNENASIAASSVKGGDYSRADIKGYAIKGLTDATDRAKAEYTALGRDVVDATRNILKKLANGNREELGEAMGLVYAAETGKIK